MKYIDLHRWDLTPQQAIALQKRLAGQVVLNNTLPKPIERVAGVDVSYRRWGQDFYAAVVVLDYASMEIVESVSANGVVDFPYVPGLLSFRELPVLLQAFKRLQTRPDVILADAQGIAHPRRLGLASHLGLWLDLPTIGCAKSRLCGEGAEPGPEQGGWTRLTEGGEEIGRLVRSRARARPLFVSPGHKIDFEGAVTVTLHCCRGYRLPEPTRQAHLLSNRIRREFELEATVDT